MNKLPWLLLFVLLVSCAQPQVPTDHFYRLRITNSDSPLATPLLKGTLEVELNAEGLVDGRNIIYSEAAKANELKEYHYHFWAEPPKIMLRDQLIAYLRASGIADKVVTHEMRASPDYVITGKIKRLEKITGDDSQATVELELALGKTAGNDILMLKTYSVSSGADSDSVPAAVTAINEALGQIFAKFIKDISKSSSTVP